MAVYHGPRCRQCRREGVKLMLKGERCRSEKCAVDRRPYPPGMRMTKRRRSTSEYNAQLREKQKMRRIYGILERQFHQYFKKASKSTGVTGEMLLRMLEMRIDNIVYRIGFAPSRSAARLLVLHNHFKVNGKNVNVPSYQLKEGDVVTVREKSKTLEVIHSALKAAKDVPEWLSVDKVQLSGTVVRLPARADIPVTVQEQLVVELYSK
ncbi:MAG TPA: 30S ribosomal protein S4 [Chitinivibrionales bacterium]|nr:30S ribosomal protein S4 [Chitinivibrionales bacterium]